MLLAVRSAQRKLPTHHPKASQFFALGVALPVWKSGSVSAVAGVRRGFATASAAAVQAVDDGGGGTWTTKSEHSENQIRRNPVDVQMLSHSLHSQLFPHPSPPPSERNIATSRAHLKSNGLLQTITPAVAPINIDLPPLQGANIDHHFHMLGLGSAEPYASLAESFSRCDLPPRPSSYVHVSGWMKYHPDGSHEPVAYPKGEEMLTFDVEVLYKINPYPVMAVAATPNAWYIWLSPWLLNETQDEFHLVPLGPTDQHRLVIGHNVGYDRARIKEEYSLTPTKNRFVDTMALHISFGGMTSDQRPQWMLYNKAQKQDEEEAVAFEEATEKFLYDEMAAVQAQLEGREDQAEVEAGKRYLKSLKAIERQLWDRIERKSRRPPAAPPVKKKNSKLTPAAPLTNATKYAEWTWQKVTSPNGLADTSKFYLNSDMSKAQRDIFSSTDKTDVLLALDDSIEYCAKDVEVTHHVYQGVLPRYFNKCPSPVTFAGMLEMGSSFLPVNEGWDEYCAKSEGLFIQMTDQITRQLAILAEDARARYACRDYGWWKLENGGDGKEPWEDDPWLSQLDWTPKKVRVNGRIIRGTGAPTAASATKAVPAKVKLTQSPTGIDHPDVPLLLRLTWKGFPIVRSVKKGWVVAIPTASLTPDLFTTGPLNDFTSDVDEWIFDRQAEGTYTFFSLPPMNKTSSSVRSPILKGFVSAAIKNRSGWLSSTRDAVTLEKILNGLEWERDVLPFVQEVEEMSEEEKEKKIKNDPWIATLGSWFHSGPTADVPKAKRHMQGLPAPEDINVDIDENGRAYIPPSPAAAAASWWPAWFSKLYEPKAGVRNGSMHITTKTTITPLLLRLTWGQDQQYPVYRSKVHKWLYAVPNYDIESGIFKPSRPKVDLNKKLAVPASEQTEWDDMFDDDSNYAEAEETAEDEDGADDVRLNAMSRSFTFYKIPHPDGEKANVGLLFSKLLVPYSEKGILNSDNPLAKEAIAMNAQCSYWLSSRKRILEQIVVWDEELAGLKHHNQFIKTSLPPTEVRRQGGVILPQVTVMGTITRRAVERTWLTASNAKKNRLGSELKAMVQAPPGYCFVGADVDSEELWIASVMGDAQFGFHGASAIGWMTLEGTKSEGTDLHSKTASIVGSSRDLAKVFNYSRIYGAGVKNATKLLITADPNLPETTAKSKAQALYKATKGEKVPGRLFDKASKMWHGGSESYLFNSIEEVAYREEPRTPTLGCGITTPLQINHLAPDKNDKEAAGQFITSRINWVVQSSGVDYLHLLIVAMNHLCRTYDINARYMISIHDEIRYMVKEEDRYRAALAIQIANLWTRTQFSYKLGMDDLPQSIAFFSAVDIDHVLRKEVDMECKTPSHPDAIPPGESLDINQLLGITHAQLLKPGVPSPLLQESPLLSVMWEERGDDMMTRVYEDYSTRLPPDELIELQNSFMLEAQATKDPQVVKELSKQWQRIAKGSEEFENRPTLPWN